MTNILNLPSLGLGANFIGGHNIHQNVEDTVGKTIVETALDHGFTFFDTAYMYGFGRSEEIIGEVLFARGKRQDVIVATKGAHIKTDDGVKISNDPAFLEQQVESSLKRLQTDYIDLYYIHFPDETTPKAEAVGILQRLKEQGKIRAIGVSNFSIEQIKEANADGYIDYIQGEYNLLNRQAETELFPLLKQHNIGFIPYFPLASGILAGKYTKDTVFTDGRAKRPNYQGERYIDILNKVEQLKPIASKYGAEVANVVLAYYLTNPIISSVIPGAKRPEQVVVNKEAAKISLSKQEIELIEQLFPLGF